MCCHSIQLDPSDPNRMYIAISAAGTFRTDDGAESWSPANKGVAADFFPSLTTSRRSASASTSCCSTQSGPTASAAEPLRGYRSDDRGETWERLGERPPERLRLPARARSARSRRRVRDPGGRRGEQGHPGREARRLPDRRRRRQLGAGVERTPRAGVGCGHARGLHVRRIGALRRLLRDAERLGVRVDRRRSELDGDRAPAATGALGRKRRWS